MVFHHDSSDPLALVIAPPPNETAEERAAREEREAEAQRISDSIDAEINADRIARKKREGVVKILLLGQSESGKSTTLKNFRMKYAHDKWIEERASWRTVIQLNLVRAINIILDALQLEMSGVPLEDEVQDPNLRPLVFTSEHQRLKLRLGPLRGVESDLKRLLGSATNPQSRPSSRAGTPSPTDSPKPSQEFSVRSWNLLSVLQAPRQDRSKRTGKQDGVDPNDITEVIASCRDDMVALWKDDLVREVLKRRRIKIDDSASFFLSQLSRLSNREYQPTDEDILRARLRTVDIQEHELRMGDGDGRENWIIYDVGGSRTQRAAWLPYFDQVNAVIFLAPISCFDEKLIEDPRVNRLEDSFILWKAVCSSKLLTNTTLIMFLNKIDLLEKKIANGILIKQHLPSYGDRPNETGAVVKYLRQKFKDTVKQCSPEPRACHVYPTSVTDPKTTAVTLLSVRDGILREHLKRANFV
ncbi:guanine nucleotide binding protein, alpha subunit [Hygrophoropsis aurantiaca]|uniref:Guanine nucleotide binding protein, alpha subunit n=1 Tax=Hygrophoropsis aurantiaca TaxID=72124 RepID=A0ACB8AIF8_9AGAM|nr:guanine nucleotide binding protein, alpha subunit [Hygrophoropsis aurantiaca]